MKSNKLNDKWVKASIIGTIWAASEIVLGSFLHNIKVPFSGNLLTAIAIIILISISYKWTEKGLFWRAGLICAIMKTISPSAIIFGPMIAIFSEAVLLEVSVRLFGRTLFGFALGGMLAMSWNLFQKIVNFIIFYGFNIVEVYTNLLRFAQKQLNIHFDIVWLPIIVLLVLFCLFGLASSVIGIMAGRRIVKQPDKQLAVVPYGANNKVRQGNQETVYSIPWLFADLLLMTGGLVLLNFTTLVYWSSSVICIVTIWAFRYKRALRQVSRPKFWIFFVAITMITAFIFTGTQSGGNSLTDGLLIGLQMNFRAAIVIVGFSVLGTELNNPVIKNFFLRTSFKQLPLALELSFESLPVMIANIPDLRTVLRQPVLVVSQFIAMAESRLDEMNKERNRNTDVFILTGAIESGKTTYVKKVISLLNGKGVKTGGICCPKVKEEGVTTGYEIVDLAGNRKERFLVLAIDDTMERIGRFSILPDGLTLGKAALDAEHNKGNQLIVIDEAGPLELSGRGWAESIDSLISRGGFRLLIVVRRNILEKAIQKWDIDSKNVFDIEKDDYEFVVERVMGGMEQDRIR